MSPRPILKRSVSTTNHSRVHFPPSPSLTRTFTVHSSATYDRSPIVVSHNSCALPERGCPGRTYQLDEQQKGIRCARDYHPRALSFASNRPSSSSTTYPPVPPLVPDLSSESEESDGFTCLPPDNLVASFGVHGLSTACEDDPALAFLPYPSPKNHHYQQQPDSTDDDAQHAFKSRRKRTERKHESSRDPDRIPRSPSSDFGIGSLSISPPTSRSPTRKKGVRPQRLPVLPPSFSSNCGFNGGFGAPDDGCLGGF